MRAALFAPVTIAMAIALGACQQSSPSQSEGQDMAAESALARRTADGPSHADALWVDVDLENRRSANTVAKDGVKVTFTVVQDKPEIIDGVEFPGDRRAIAHVQYAGLPPISVPLVENSVNSWTSIQVGIGKLNRSDSAPTTLIQAYSGGSHCCFYIKGIVASGAKLRVIDFPVLDGEGLQEYPKDIDHDGRADFVMDDSRFKGKFASWASSLSLKRILNIADDGLMDVSARPSFAAMFEQDLRMSREACADGDWNAACAAYAAAAARLGRSDRALKEVNAWASKDFKFVFDACKTKLVDSPDGAMCPRGQEMKFQSLAAALRWFLKTIGYIDQPKSYIDHGRPLSCPDHSKDLKAREIEQKWRLC